MGLAGNWMGDCSHGVSLNSYCQECIEISQTPILHEQIGGDHYKTMAIQPAEFCHRNGIGYMEGLAIKYLCRWKKKNGVEDLKKAVHCIQLLIELETKV